MLLLVHIPDMLQEHVRKEQEGEFGITEVPNYRAFNPTYTELEIAAELVPKLRLSLRNGNAKNICTNPWS